MTFRSSNGRFSPGVILTSRDLENRLLKIPGDHWEIPPWAPSPWRIPASRVAGCAPLFPPKSRPTVRTILWSLHEGRRPLGKLTPNCGISNCINPLHQEESMSLSSELCETYFSEAYAAAASGKPLTLPLPNEGKATAYRFQLHKWRSANSDSIPPEWTNLILRIKPMDPAFPHGPFILIAELDSDSEEFASILTSAIGGEKPKSAVELLNELEKGD